MNYLHLRLGAKMTTLFLSALLSFVINPFRLIAGDFGPADFPGDSESGLPKSYHDAWCKQLRKECRIVFEGRSMTVQGFKGITRDQLLSIRSAADGNERYFYVTYLNGSERKTTALFMFVHERAAFEFGEALSRWYEQDSALYPNYRFPSSQGPQNTNQN